MMVIRPVSMIPQAFVIFLLKLNHEIGKKSLIWTEESYRNYKVNAIA